VASDICTAASGLEALVSGFDRDPIENRALIRREMDLNPDAFYASAIEIFKTQLQSRGAQYLVALLVSNDLFLRAVCDKGLDRDQTMSLARAALRVDPMLDVRLVRTVADSVDSGIDHIPPMAAGRLLEILGDMAPINRLLPSLVRLLRHEDPYLRSKAVLMVGRANRSARWTGQRLADPDIRIRANAVEGLWGVQSDDVRELLRGAGADWNNRVAGNALLGLYQIGDVASIPEILAMTTNKSVLFRCTAAWIMGETASPRFLESLAAMLRDPGPAVRKRAFSALRKIKDAAQTVPPAQWNVAARISASDAQKGTRRLTISVASEGKQQPALLGTHIFLTEDGRPVHDYKFMERPCPDSLAAVFLFPRLSQEDAPQLQGALHCLRWKRTSDFWASAQFLAGEPGGAPPAGSEMVSFQASAESAESALRQLPQKMECSDIWHSLWRVLHAETAVRSKRHVILFSPQKAPDAAGLELPAALLTRGSLQVISMVPDTQLENLCAKVNGIFEVAGSTEDVPRLIAQAYLRLMGRYEITYAPTVETAALRVRVLHPQGRGESTVVAPPAVKG
jgi:hypothetical protein